MVDAMFLLILIVGTGNFLCGVALGITLGKRSK